MSETPYLEKGKKARIEGVVYCLTHTTVHGDTTDPYDYGYASCLTEASATGRGTGVTKAQVHRTLFVGLRKGDVDEDLVD
jgi:hypothetical protein